MKIYFFSEQLADPLCVPSMRSFSSYESLLAHCIEVDKRNKILNMSSIRDGHFVAFCMPLDEKGFAIDVKDEIRKYVLNIKRPNLGL